MSHPSRPVRIEVYRITGRQGFLEIPHRYCEECDLTVNVVRGVVEALGDSDVSLVVRPWMLWWWKPLLRGGWHAPVVTVNGRVISQGVVPSRERVLHAIRDARAGRLARAERPTG